MAVVAANMFVKVIAIVAAVVASARAGYYHSQAPNPYAHRPGGGGSRMYEPMPVPAPAPSSPYMPSLGLLYPPASYNTPVAVGQSTNYQNIPVGQSQSSSYAPSALYSYGYATVPGAQYTSSQSLPLPVSQNSISSSLSAPVSGSQTIQYSSSQIVPLPAGQNYHSSSRSTPLSGSQTIQYSTHNAPLPVGQSHYSSSQSSSSPAFSSQSYYSSNNNNYASTHASLPSNGQNAYTPGHISQIVIPYTKSQTSYAATPSAPLSISQTSNAVSQSSSTAGSYAANVNYASGKFAVNESPYTTSQVSYAGSSQTAPQVAHQAVLHTNNQSPEITKNTEVSSYSKNGVYDYSRPHNNGQYYHQTESAPAVLQNSDNNYQIEHHNSESQSNSQNFITTQTVTHQSGPINLDQSYAPGYVNQVAPVVTKHIYFHAPPPDLEERPVQQGISMPPKKVYNIVFIKVPSQESRSYVNGRVISASHQAPIEDKTLIYVLVKKPEPQPQQKPRPVTSEHEVFYVKYKGDPNEVANRINGKLSQQTALQTDVQGVIEPVLQATSRNDGSSQHSLPIVVTDQP
ncbi:hypothetical protein O0L34_g2586 [Tuta absoluta]|nr:hypothetical protein O0L34_g2586 [Tuta absoluta]